MTTSAAAPAARCRNCRRGSFIALPSGGARDNCGLMHRATASIGEWRSVPASVALNEYRIGEEESAGEVTKMDNPGAGLGAVRDELAAPDRLPSVRGSHPSTSLWECRVVQHSKIGRSMSAGGHNEKSPFSALRQLPPAADITAQMLTAA